MVKHSAIGAVAYQAMHIGIANLNNEELASKQDDD